MNDFTVTGGRINNRSAACHDSYMAAYNDDITGTQIREAADPGVSSRVSPAGGCHVALTHANLV